MVRVADVDVPHGAGDLQVALEVGRHDEQAGTAQLSFPDGLAGFDAELFGLLALRQYDAVAQLGVAAHGHGLAPELRAVPLFY